MNGHVPCQDPLAELCGQFEVAVYIQKRESRHTPVASKEHQLKGTPAVVVWQTMFTDISFTGEWSEIRDTR